MSPASGFQRNNTVSAAGHRRTAHTSKRRYVPTLVRKNWWLKKKNRRGLLLEILVPVLFVALMGLVKRQTNDIVVAPGFSQDNSQFNLFQKYGGDGNVVMAPLFAPKYAVQETSLTGLLLHLDKLSFDFGRGMKTFEATQKAACQQEIVMGGKISLNESSPYAVPSVCDGRVSPVKIAIAPDVPFTRQYFYETVAKWYPTIALNVTSNTTIVVPSLADSVVFYDTEKDLEEYVKSKEYAATASQPRIFGAIVFDEFPTEAAIGSYAPIEFTLRLNATYIGEDTSMRYVPRTSVNDESSWDQFQRGIDTLSYQQYASGGFMTLQTLVARFVNCMPKWDTTRKTTSGECQAVNAVAKGSAELDARLLKTVVNDPAIQQVLAEALKGSGDLAGLDTAIPGDFAMTAGAKVAPELEVPLTAAQAEALVKPLRQAPQPLLGSLTSPFPTDRYTKSTFYDTTQSVFPIFFLLTYVSTLSKILVSLISERETRVRES